MGIWDKEIADEVTKQLWVAGPMICVCVCQYSLQMLSLMFVGHLDELLLAGASLATSFVNVTGFNVLVCSQYFLILCYGLPTFRMCEICACLHCIIYGLWITEVPVFILCHHFNLYQLNKGNNKI